MAFAGPEGHKTGSAYRKLNKRTSKNSHEVVHYTETPREWREHRQQIELEVSAGNFTLDCLFT